MSQIFSLPCVTFSPDCTLEYIWCRCINTSEWLGGQSKWDDGLLQARTNRSRWRDRQVYEMWSETMTLEYDIHIFVQNSGSGMWLEAIQLRTFRSWTFRPSAPCPPCHITQPEGRSQMEITRGHAVNCYFLEEYNKLADLLSLGPSFVIGPILITSSEGYDPCNLLLTSPCLYIDKPYSSKSRFDIVSLLVIICEWYNFNADCKAESVTGT